MDRRREQQGGHMHVKQHAAMRRDSSESPPPAARKRSASKGKARGLAAATCSGVIAFQAALPRAQIGTGEYDTPYQLPLRTEPNHDGCLHCPTANCECCLFSELLEEAVRETRQTRIVEVAGKNHLCAKSVLPPFVARLAALLDVRHTDTFYDLGSGNGSVCFQMAFMTGCRAIGVELSRSNAAMSRELWSVLCPKLERATGRRMPEVTIIDGDLADVIMDEAFVASGEVAIWTANLLMPRAVTHFMSERFRQLPRGARIAAFDDLYPHGKPSSRSRDPEAFELFRMQDYVWPPLSVEWMSGGGGRFFQYTRV